MDMKEYLMYGKLSLFDMNLRNDIQESKEPTVHDLVRRRSKKDNLGNVGLLHQASFLSHAYVCLVWLWERAKKESLTSDIESIVSRKFDLNSSIKISGQRSLKNHRDHIRLVRNAISHGNVDVDEEFFIFSDINPKKENEYTSIRMKWSDLALLSDIVFVAMTLVFQGDGDA